MLEQTIFNEVPEVVHNAVLDALNSLEEERDSVSQKNKRSMGYLPKVAAVGLACLFLSGITVSAMGAVRSYRQRMEAMNAELLEEYYSIADAAETTLMSRGYTDSEETRYAQLYKEYEDNGVFPESQITCLESAGAYKGKGVALDSATRTLYLPDKELSDEELLEIIDFHHKVGYSVEKKEEERFVEETIGRKRLEEMDDAEVDKIYRIMFTSHSDVSGAYSRSLTADENSRYTKLSGDYTKGTASPVSEPTVIQKPEEYTGEGVAICPKNSIFYFPESEMTDEELLELIDYQRKAQYCIDRITKEVQAGIRDGYPYRDTEDEDGTIEGLTHTEELVAKTIRADHIEETIGQTRLGEMDDQKVDEIYLSLFAGDDVKESGAYCRPLTEDEEKRYEELTRAYEKETAYAASEPSIIQNPEEYTGKGIAVCMKNGAFYFPDCALTDEELLLIIDYEHKAAYSYVRIEHEMEAGIREDLPHLK